MTEVFTCVAHDFASTVHNCCPFCGIEKLTRQPQWTKETPTVPGWYWLKSFQGVEVVKVHDGEVLWVDSEGGEKLERMPEGYEWCGPLTPPE
jgi:hypothetical protein